MQFVVADLHLGHRRLVEEFGERPFKTIEEHDETLIANHNSRVCNKDDVYILGDIFLGARKNYIKTVRRLNGNLHLIRGNHCRGMNLEQKRMFAWVKDIYKLKVVDKIPYYIVLCHYPMRSWEDSHKGTWMLHGHDHGKLGEDPNLLSFCVSINTIGFYPMSFDQIKVKMLWIKQERKLLWQRNIK